MEEDKNSPSTQQDTKDSEQRALFYDNWYDTDDDEYDDDNEYYD